MSTETDATVDSRKDWIGICILVAAVYAIGGVSFAELAKSASSHQMVTVWRLAAWVISFVAFGAQLRFEVVRLGSSPMRTAQHAALAVALGSFGLAVAAVVHSQSSTPPGHFPIWALIIWPIVTAAPAFVAAFGLSAVLIQTRRNA
jgi:acetyl-CoA acetyltransferase